MNETFDSGRFGNLLAYECRNYLPRVANLLITYVCILFSLWVTMAVVQESATPGVRLGFMTPMFNIACAIGPFLIYYNANDRKKGYHYAMIPASTLEKFISMLLVCALFVPALVYITMTITDVLLYLVSPRYEFGFSGFEFYRPFTGGMDDFWPTATLVHVGFMSVLSYLFTIVYSMMFNMLLRSAKIIKMILFNIAIIFTVIMMVVYFTLNFDIELPDFIYSINHETVLYALYIIYATVIVLFGWLTYRRIKKVNY